ncbi:MAG: GAF domain-containing protein [Deltaproteobacteria bacterium]|nr:GAF domain-containing protein [Deltaproteobacteria bacterium]
MALKEPSRESLAEQQAQRLRQCLAGVREIQVAIAAGADLSAVLSLVLDRVNAVSPLVAAGFVVVLESSGGELKPLASKGVQEAGMDLDDWKSWCPSARSVFETKTSLKIPDLELYGAASARESLTRPGWVSYLGIPLVAEDQAVGVLSIFSEHETFFSDEEIEMFSLLAAQAAAAIHHRNVQSEATTRLAELASENRLKNQFLGLLSTELRTPLNSVVGYASMLQEKMLGDLNPEQQSALAALLRGCHDQLRVINGIMEVMKIETLKEQVLHGARPLSEAVDEFERELIEKALKDTGYNQTRAASILGTTRRILRYKMDKLQLKAPSSGAKKEDGAEKGSQQDEE